MPAIDSRKHARQKSQAIDLVWQVESLGLSGEGRLVDVSLTGVCIEITTTRLQGRAGLVFSLQVPRVPAAPKQARLRWYRRVTNRSSVYLCGLAFLEPYEQCWRDWIAAYIGQQDILMTGNPNVTVEDIIGV